MTIVQKVIKYLAIAFAIFLLFSIVSAFTSVGREITNAFVPENSNEYKIEEIEGLFSYLDIKLVASSLEIKKGDNLKVEFNNEDVKISQENNKILIEEQSKSWFFNKKPSNIILYVPENLKFDDVKIETGAGKLNIENIETESLKLRLGAGKTVIDNIISNNNKIETGAGELIIKNGKLNDSSIEVGVGKLVIEAEITGNNKIESGIGSTNIVLLGDDYKVTLKKGIGDIYFNNKSIKSDTTIGEGNNYIIIDGGIGSINVKTKKDLENF